MTAPRRRGGRRGLLAIVGVLLLTVAAVGLVAVQALGVRARLIDGRSALEQARDAGTDGDLDRTRAALGEAITAFDDADRRLAAGPLRAAALVPAVRQNLRAIRTLARAGGAVARAGAGVTAAMADQPGGIDAYAPRGGRIPVEALSATAPALHEAVRELDSAAADTRSQPDTLLLPMVSDADRELRQELDRARRSLGSAASLAAVLPRFLGAEGPRRYFFGAQTPAELRGTGGLIGAFAILEVEDGHLRFGPFASVTTIGQVGVSELAAPEPSYAARYDRYGSSGFMSNINMTPDFPSAATAIEQLYEHQRGERLDGTIVADPFAFAALLRVAGPAEVPGVGRVSADEVVELVSREAYGLIEDGAQRKEVLGAVATAVLADVLTDPAIAPQASARAVADAAAEGHLLLHAADPEIQQAFTSVGVAGALPDDGDQLAVIGNNAAGNKADLFAQRTVRQTVSLLPDGSAESTIAVEIHNGAPTTGFPRDIIGPYREDLQAGENRTLLSLYCPSTCALQGVRREGIATTAASEVELGRSVFTTTVALQSDQRARLDYELRTTEAWQGGLGDGSYQLTVHGQPSLLPTTYELAVLPPPGTAFTRIAEGRIEEGTLRWSGELGQRLVVQAEFRQRSGALERLMRFLREPFLGAVAGAA